MKNILKIGREMRSQISLKVNSFTVCNESKLCKYEKSLYNNLWLRKTVLIVAKQHYDIIQQVEACKKKQEAYLEGLNKNFIVTLPIKL